MKAKEAIMILESIQPSCDKYSYSESEIYEAIDMAIEVLECSEIPNCSEPKCADGCIYGWGSSECGHCDYRSEEPKTGDTISRKAAIDVAIKADIENHGGVLSEKRARIIDKRISAMPPARPERTCVNCGRTANNGGWYADGGTRCPIEEHYALPKDGFCHLWEKRNVTDDDYPERREE